MRFRRSDRPKTLGELLAGEEYDQAAGEPLQVLGPDQRIILRTVPFTLAFRHSWRALPCLVCRQSGNGRPVRLVTVTGDLVSSPNYSRAGTISYLVCAGHFPLSDAALYKYAHKLEHPGCSCNSESAAGAAAYPYSVHEVARLS